LGAETAYLVSERPEKRTALRRDGPVVLEVVSSIRIGRSQVSSRGKPMPVDFLETTPGEVKGVLLNNIP
jgi:hypothetical protein